MVKCDYCGEKIKKSEATYVEGRLYCKECVSEAEIYSDHGEDDYEDEDEEEDEEEDDDDDDDD